MIFASIDGPSASVPFADCPSRLPVPLIRESLVMKAFAISFALLLLLSTHPAAAAPPDPHYGAGVLLQNMGSHLYEGQFIAGGSLTNTVDGSTLITEGVATFVDSSAHISSVFSVSPAFTQGWAAAFVSDTLTFHVANGSSALVPVNMAGTWNAQGSGGEVSYVLMVGTAPYVGRAFATGLSESFANGVPVVSAFSYGPGDYITGVDGTYEVDALLNVVDGGVYSISATVRADGLGGNASAFIKDPLTIALPLGVSFTAASGSTYTVAGVPEPSTWFLMSVGLLSICWLLRRRAQPSPI
jgi:PEP-CTERM motif